MTRSSYCFAGVVLVFTGTVTAEPASTNRNASLEVQVLAPRLSAPVSGEGVGTVAGALKTEPRVLINSQGGAGAQNDLSIRGSSFSGAGLSLEGLSLRNPQTEHHNAELSVPAGVLTAPRVLTGLEQRLETDGHLAGSVSADLAPITAERSLSVGGGQVNRNWQNLLYRQPLGASDQGVQAGLGVFGYRESADGLDYPDNDLDREGGGLQVQGRSEDSQADLVAAVQRKKFGARGYYGVRPDWYADEELNDFLVLGRWRTESPGGSWWRVTTAWRKLQDDYQLFWTLPGVYANHHDSKTGSAVADGRWEAAEPVALRWRAGVEDERLSSDLLGDHDRQRAHVTAAPEWTAGPCTVDVGGRGEFFSDDTPAWLPLAGLTFRLNEALQPYAEYSEGVRQPSYTELNYDSPGSLGNQGLQRQHTREGEAGVRGNLTKQAYWKVALFAQQSENTVDWVKAKADSPRWVATDLGTVDTQGAEAELRLMAADGLYAGLGYTALHRTDDVSYYAGRYVLDYPEHLLRLSLDWRINPVWSLGTAQTVRQQHEDPLRTSGDWGIDGSVVVRITPAWRGSPVRFDLYLDNVWDDDFDVYPGQPVAGRRVSCGLTVQM